MSPLYVSIVLLVHETIPYYPGMLPACGRAGTGGGESIGLRRLDADLSEALILGTPRGTIPLTDHAICRSYDAALRAIRNRMALGPVVGSSLSG
jgi:hypothetical protein